ncbi:hypothetical protein ACGFX4_36225 [Kitasatospora sp. NPDC048365]|uniref:polysaccharide biosynthesis C-terminal domain-containing protein n=1 Tax=Kitasatospora sp. NPDC048365 TaxID=3364050 RepID=UPI003721CA43
MFHVLPDGGDVRGSSFSLPDTWLQAVAGFLDVHATTLVPGGVRGNHYHLSGRELLLVLHRESWSAHWDTGEGTPVSSRTFPGPGAVLVEVALGCSHAVRNDGSTDLQIIGFRDRPFDPADPDAHPREVVPV